MKKTYTVLIALCLSLCLLLTGCNLVDIGGFLSQLGSLGSFGSLTPFHEMSYTRPNMVQFDNTLQKVIEQASTEKKLTFLLDGIYEFYSVYDDFCTNYALVNIYYNQDLTNSRWQEEYNYCLENASTVNAGLDSLYRALAKSPLREKLEGEDYFGPGFFEAYEGDTLYDETFQSYLAQEAQLTAQYYTVSGEAGSVDYYSDAYFTQYGTQLAEIFLELVKVRQQMAQYAGYESYPDFAYDFYYGRDYTAAQTKGYLASIQTELSPLYVQVNQSGYWDKALASSSQKHTLDYVRSMAAAMGGIVEDAFSDMEAAQLYDISYGPNKFSGSFEVFLPNYYSPFVFVNPTNTIYDKLTFAHEFGHFCTDYASMGSIAGIDVAEVFSQGMEYLSLCYVSDPQLEELKMADSLRVFVEQAAYASFEQQVYSLTGDSLTTEGIQALYAQIGTDFGLQSLRWDSRDYVCIPHFFVSPMYIISYVVSNDVALQLYRQEKAETGKGLATLEANLTTPHSGIQAFVKDAGLESPFNAKGIQEVKKLLEEILK